MCNTLGEKKSIFADSKSNVMSKSLTNVVRLIHFLVFMSGYNNLTTDLPDNNNILVNWLLYQPLQDTNSP